MEVPHSMTNQITIGPAVRRRRREIGWGLQKLCDEIESPMYPGYLSDIETGKINPGIDKAYFIAKALRTTLDTLLSESMQEGPPRAPSEVVSRVPVIPWSRATEWVENPDISRIPPESAWELPIDNRGTRGFYMRVIDDSMHAPAGPSFAEGSLIYVDPTMPVQANDFIVGYAGDRSMPDFKKLVKDGSQQYLRSLNPQFPVRPLPENFVILGVVTGCVTKVARGMFR